MYMQPQTVSNVSIYQVSSAQLVRPTFTQDHVPQKDFLLVVCKYTSNKNLQKSSRPNSFAIEKAGDVVDTMCIGLQPKKHWMWAL